MSKKSLTLVDDLHHVDPALRQRIERAGGLSLSGLVSLTRRPDADPALYFPRQVTREQVTDWTDVTLQDEERGERALAEGEVAFVILAGGAGTRMGAPKPLMTLPDVGLTLLGYKLLQAGQIPVWIMTTPGMITTIHGYVSSLGLPTDLKGSVFEQFEGLRLTPENRLSLVDGVPELYPLGHGDVGPALLESGVLDDNPNVKFAYVCNVDNVLATPHPGIIGRHIRTGTTLTCEVVERRQGDRGGVLATLNGDLQIAEDFRLPAGFADSALFHNTNTMLINVEALRWSLPWRFHRVRKQVGDRIVIQHERLLQQYTEECASEFIVVPRDARYCPIKAPADLEAAGKLISTYRFK